MERFAIFNESQNDQLRSDNRQLIRFTEQWKFQSLDYCNKCRFWDSNTLARTAALAEPAGQLQAAEAELEVAAATDDNTAEQAAVTDDKAPDLDGIPREAQVHGTPDLRDEVPEPSRSCTAPGTARRQSLLQESFSWFGLLVH